MIQSYKDLKVYQFSYAFAMDVFRTTAKFPKQERHSLTDQLRRSSRSISANIVEGWAKRRYESVFRRQLVDAIGSREETKLWLQFAHDRNYIDRESFPNLTDACEEVGRMLFGLCENWKTYQTRKK
jgi:four helix bundle protein